LAHRRNQRNKNRTKIESNNQDLSHSLSSLQMNLKKEKEIIPIKKSNPIFYAIPLIIIILGAGLFAFTNFNLTGNGAVYQTPDGNVLTMPDNMPSRYDTTLTDEPKLSSAYDYAMDHGDVLSHLICYCGCNNQMHTPYHETNKECFWTVTGAREAHAESCSTCVYIALSAKSLTEAGWPISNIRSFIDNQYK
jgi:hypothetical protein